MAASQSLAERIHELLAESLAEQLENGTTVRVKTEDGGYAIEQVSPPASVLEAARKFVRDCGVEVNPERVPGNVTGIADRLDELSDEDFPTDFPQ
jgi:hypothetical protein